jgi:hypothetical protein
LRWIIRGDGRARLQEGESFEPAAAAQDGLSRTADGAGDADQRSGRPRRLRPGDSDVIMPATTTAPTLREPGPAPEIRGAADPARLPPPTARRPVPERRAVR